MSFSSTSPNDCFVRTETLTLASGAATTINSSSFAVGNNQDFVVFANTDATNTTNTVRVDILGSFDNSTFAVIKSSLIADVDAAVKAALYDVTTNGFLPYYKVSLVPTADEKAKTIGIAVVTGKR
jgi:hypothetical protein